MSISACTGGRDTKVLEFSTSSLQLSQSLRQSRAPLPQDSSEAYEATNVFRLGVSISTFKASQKLPWPTANVFIKLEFPAALWEGHDTPQKVPMAIRTSPPVSISRGTEGIIPKGASVVKITSTILKMATMLVTGPSLIAEVRRQRFTYKVHF